jgi:hypothetical protein
MKSTRNHIFGLLHLLPGIVILFLSAGCTEKQKEPTAALPAAPSASQATPFPVNFRFTDVTRKAGITFKHNNGAFGAMLLPETMGSGAAFIDYNGDGWQDLFFVNGRNWTHAEVTEYKNGKINPTETKFLLANRSASGFAVKRQVPREKPYQRTGCALYRNNHDGTFTDVTRGSGLEVEMLGMGAAVGDYDNDGRPDLCVTSCGCNYLFRNLTASGAGARPRFREEAVQAGVKDSDWTTCAAFVDYDKDGLLDLFIGRYLRWSPSTDIFRSLNGRRKSYGWPIHYKPQSSHLYRNLGNGRFRDVSAQAGILRQPGVAGKPPRALLGKALGVVVCDANQDGWPDIIVANDMVPNFFFLNKGNGTFSEVGTSSGITLSRIGRPRGGMGIDAADIDQSGWESVAIGHFNAEMLGLYYNLGKGVYNDIAPNSEVGQITDWFLTFGLLFTDVNNDGRPDLLVANGHIDPDVDQVGPSVGYSERPLLFLNESKAKGQPEFREVGEQCGAPLSEKLVARGLAAADYDLDGDLDFLITVNGGRPRLWRNDGGNKNNAVRLVLRGSKSNRSAIGVSVEARIGDKTLRRMVRSGSSYLSQSELPLTLGLGKAPKVDALTLHWPGGTVTRLKNISANQIVTISESSGLVKQQPYTVKSRASRRLSQTGAG